MFERLITINHSLDYSFFLFGPRGTGKTSWLKHYFPNCLYFDLLNEETYISLLGDATRLGKTIPSNYNNWVIIDEIQKCPELLDEVHRLIEGRKLRFIMTGSSARKLKRSGSNLLAGRARLKYMHPITAIEQANDFDIKYSLVKGHLPTALSNDTDNNYLKSYVATYLKEEVMQEGLVRNISLFTKFLEVASFSQGEVLNYTEIARDVGSNRHSIENFFTILEDLLIAVRLPVFTRRVKRQVVKAPKFYYFDTGVYRAIRPKGPLDSNEEIDGACLETLFFQEVRAINDYYDLDYSFYYWRTRNQQEVDFVLYGEKGFMAFEIKRKTKLTSKDYKGLKAFSDDYPEAKCILLYGGEEQYSYDGIEVMPIEEVLRNLTGLIDS